MISDGLNEQENLVHVLAQYGQAMIRIGQLEKELDLSANRTHTPAKDTGVVDVSTKRETTDLKAKLQACEQELVALRLQLETVHGELNETKTKLKLAAEGNYIRHRKNKETNSIWKKLLRGKR
jgi:predicted  nucleic acid-binding Zn-ribbon protein